MPRNADKEHAEEDYTDHSSAALCCCDFHSECGEAVHFLSNPVAGLGVSIVCDDCLVVVPAEAVSHRISLGVEHKIKESKLRNQ